jgi:hypothetical protein
MQDGQSICVGLDKSPKLQIFPAYLRQLPMATSGVATAGEWQLEAAIIQQVPKLCGEAHPVRTVSLWAAKAPAKPFGARPTRRPLVTT